MKTFSRSVAISRDWRNRGVKKRVKEDIEGVAVVTNQCPRAATLGLMVVGHHAVLVNQFPVVLLLSLDHGTVHGETGAMEL